MLALLLFLYGGVFGNEAHSSLWANVNMWDEPVATETFLRFTDPGTGSNYGLWIGAPPNLDNIDSAITVVVRGRGRTPDGDGEVTIVGNFYVFSYLGSDGYRFQIGGNLIDMTPTNWYDGDWHTIVCTYDSAGGANNMTIQEDGGAITKATKTGGIAHANNLWVGTRSGNSYHLDADLAQIQIYERIFDSTEGAWVHNYPDSVYDTTKLHLWLPMNEGVGDTAYDYSPYANHANLRFGVEWVSE